MINHLEPHEARCTLGVWLALDGNSNEELQYLESIATNWTKKMERAKLTHSDATFSFKMSFSGNYSIRWCWQALQSNNVTLSWKSYLLQACLTSEVEERLILVQRGYYNNPVPAYFSTSHLLILIQTRISISRLWTIGIQLWTIVSRLWTILSWLDYCNATGLY